jgi:hypothetical protein
VKSFESGGASLASIKMAARFLTACFLIEVFLNRIFQ